MTVWIDAQKYNPETGGRYLVCLDRKAPKHLGGDCKQIRIMRWTDDGWRIPRHSPEWINSEITETVTHWAPLPDMP